MAQSTTKNLVKNRKCPVCNSSKTSKHKDIFKCGKCGYENNPIKKAQMVEFE